MRVPAVAFSLYDGDRVDETTSVRPMPRGAHSSDRNRRKAGPGQKPRCTE